MNTVLRLVRNSTQREGSLAEFALEWFDQASVGWRQSTTRRVNSILQCHLLPWLQGFPANGLTRRDVMAFRTDLARGRGPSGVVCSLTRTNSIMQVLHQMLTERERQLEISNPCSLVKRLPARRPAVSPFSLPELRHLVHVAPPHLKTYIWVRGITGLRSGEANGLQWDCVDLETGALEVRRAYADGKEQLPKNQFSERIIQLTPSVLAALREQHALTGPVGSVFRTRRGRPIDIQNFARRDWRCVLRKAGLTYRPPEQLRHTAATLMLAAGEAPTYVSKVLGHSDCSMLLRIYARYMPGALGRSDGHALEAVLSRGTDRVPGCQ